MEKIKTTPYSENQSLLVQMFTLTIPAGATDAPAGLRVTAEGVFLVTITSLQTVVSPEAELTPLLAGLAVETRRADTGT